MRVTKALILSSICGLALGVGGQAAAQTAPPHTGQDSDGISDIVVTARKISESAQSVPISIVALGGAALKEASVNTVQDLQGQVPSLILQTHPSDPQSLSLAMRGQKQVDLTLTLDTSVGLYIDGFYNPRSMGVRGALIDVARVEVLRGPQGTLYGRNTTGGALALYTNDPVAAPFASLAASYGNYDTLEVTGIANVPLGDKAGIRLVAQHTSHDGWGRDGLNRELLGEESTYLRGKFKVELGEAVSAVLSGSYNHSNNSGAIIQMANLRPPTNGGAAVSDYSTIVRAVTIERGLASTPANLASSQALLATYVNGVNGDIYHTGGAFAEDSRIRVYTAGLDVKAELSNTISARSLTGFMKLSRLNRSDLDGTPFALVGGPRTTEDKYFSQEFQLLGQSRTLQWVTGAYFGSERGNDITFSDTVPALSPTSPTIYDATVRNRSIAVFGQGVWEFLPGWRVTAGARYSWDRRVLISANSNRTTPCVVPAPGFTTTTADPASRQCPRTFVDSFAKPSFLFSIDHQFGRDILAYAKIARGYRSGGRNFKGSGNIGTFIDFKPEVVTEYEVGVKSYLFDRSLRINLSVYHDEYNDVQRVATITLPGTSALSSQTVNAASAQIRGFEADVLWKVSNQLSFNGGASLTDAKYKQYVDLTGDRSQEPFDVPKWTATIGARYTIPTSVGRLVAQTSYQWQDRFYLDPQAYDVVSFVQPAKGLLDARIALDIDAWNATVAIFGKNLTDERYYASGASPYKTLGYSFAVAGEPRRFGISITKRIGGSGE